MRKYKLDGIEVSADDFNDFLVAGVKQLQAENEVLNEENKELTKEIENLKIEDEFNKKYIKGLENIIYLVF